MPGRDERRYRIASLIHEALAALLREVHTPGLLTVRDIRLNNDYSIATVIYVVVGGDAEQTQTQLQSHAAQLRGQLARRLNMRKTPVLHFHYDSEGLAADKMREWLDGIPTETDEQP